MKWPVRNRSWCLLTNIVAWSTITRRTREKFFDRMDEFRNEKQLAEKRNWKARKKSSV